MERHGSAVFHDLIGFTHVLQTQAFALPPDAARTRIVLYFMPYFMELLKKTLK